MASDHYTERETETIAISKDIVSCVSFSFLHVPFVVYVKIIASRLRSLNRSISSMWSTWLAVN